MRKTENIDNELRQLIKSGAYDAGQDEWFTRRVMNRLPERQNRSALHLAWVFYLVAALVCAGFWLWMVYFSNPTVVTVRDLIYITMAGIVTLVLAFSPIVAMFRRE